MNLVITELLKNTGLQTLFVLACIAAIWNSATSWSQFRYMKTSMVTKKDLSITMLNHELQTREKYVTKAEFAAALGQRGHAAGRST